MDRMFAEFASFVRHFAKYVAYLRGVLLTLILLLVLGGVVISRLEGIPLGDAIYFAFVTGLTIGYGDISPATPLGRVISILIGLVGMIFTGVTVAIATRALTDAVREELSDRQST